MSYIFLVIACTFNAVANILLKLGSRNGIDLSSYALFSLIGHNWQIILGCIIFALNVGFYFLALRSLPLSTAYPIMVAMSFIIINAYAFLILGEHITSLQVFGYTLIVIGLIFVVRFGS